MIPSHQIELCLQAATGLGDSAVNAEFDQYALPSAEYLSDFGERLADYFTRGGLAYEDVKFNCVWFARMAVDFAGIEQAKYGTNPDTLAIGRCKVMMASGDMHEICCAVIDSPDPSGQTLHVKFFEPQLAMQEIPRANIAAFYSVEI